MASTGPSTEAAGLASSLDKRECPSKVGFSTLSILSSPDIF